MAANILITEDEAIVRKDIERCLTSLGYNIIATADNGEDAINKALEHKPDLCIMDIMIKGDMNGVSAAAEIKKSLDVPVIFLTAYADEGTLTQAKSAEPHGYILNHSKRRTFRPPLKWRFINTQKRYNLKQRRTFLEA